VFSAYQDTEEAVSRVLHWISNPVKNLRKEVPYEIQMFFKKNSKGYQLIPDLMMGVETPISPFTMDTAAPEGAPPRRIIFRKKI